MANLRAGDRRQYDAKGGAGLPGFQADLTFSVQTRVQFVIKAPVFVLRSRTD
jgi:hypothetical protein